MKIADTERLVLRRLTRDDLDELADMFADPEVMRFSLGTRSREDTAKWLEKRVLEAYDRLGYSFWAVELKAGGDFVGFCGLVEQDVAGRREIELGYRYKPRFWRRGFGTEAGAAARDAAFERFDLTRIISIIEPANVGSWRVAEKLGMHHERDAVVFGKSVRIYALERSD